MVSLELKLDKLDDAFLFLLGLIGIVITVMQVYMLSITGLFEIIPLIFIGIIMPFYIGYLRGAISVTLLNNSFIERLRGWIYLIVGSSAYVGYILSTRLSYRIFILDITFNLCVGVGLILTYFFLKWAVHVFKEAQRNISHEYAFSSAITSAFLFPFFFRMFVSIYSDMHVRFQYSSLLIGFIWTTFFIILVSLIYERVSRKIINANLSMPVAEIERHRKHNAFVRFSMYNIEIYLLVIATSIKSTFLWVIGLILGLLSIFLLFLSLPLFPDAYFIMSVLFLLLGTWYFFKSDVNFSRLSEIIQARAQKSNIN